MDHKDLTYDSFTTEIVLHWCLLLEYYGPIIKHINGTNNYVADTLIWIMLIKSDIIDSEITGETWSNSYFVDKWYGGMFPLTNQNIDKYQQK